MARGGSRAGSGRKPKGDFSNLKAQLSAKIPADLKKRLEAEAEDQGLNVQQLVIRALTEWLHTLNSTPNKIVALQHVISAFPQQLPGRNWENDSYFNSAFETYLRVVVRKLGPDVETDIQATMTALEAQGLKDDNGNPPPPEWYGAFFASLVMNYLSTPERLTDWGKDLSSRLMARRSSKH